MAPLTVQLLHLQPMRVASAYSFGIDPEALAWEKLVAWAKPRGLLDDPGAHPIFGFNNPYPTSETPRYGYEFWIKVGREAEPEEDIRIYEFLGGLYAVTRCEAQGDPASNIPAGWQALAGWCKENNHPLGWHQALEQFLSMPDDPGNLLMNLYCPILS